MNSALKGFVLGFGLGAAVGLLFGAPVAFFLSLLGVNSSWGLVVLVLASGFFVGSLGAILVVIFEGLDPNMRLIIAVGVLVLGLVLFQPEIDAVGALGLILAFAVPSPGEETDED